MNVYESCDQNREGAEVTQVRCKGSELLAGLKTQSSKICVRAEHRTDALVCRPSLLALCCVVVVLGVAACVLLVLISQKQRVGGSGCEVRVTE